CISSGPKATIRCCRIARSRNRFTTTASPIPFVEWRATACTKSPSGRFTPASSSPAIFASASRAKRSSSSSRACTSCTKESKSFSKALRSTRGCGWRSGFPAIRAWPTPWRIARRWRRSPTRPFPPAPLELERLYNHIADVGAICADTGFAIANAHALRLREDLLRLNARFAGQRLLRGALAPGGVARDCSAAQIADARATVARVAAEFERIVELAAANGWVLDRLHGTGRLSREIARDLQVVGVPARASGID